MTILPLYSCGDTNTNDNILNKYQAMNNRLSEITMGTKVFSNEQLPIRDTKIQGTIHMDLAATVRKRDFPITHSHNQGIYSALFFLKQYTLHLSQKDKGK